MCACPCMAEATLLTLIRKGFPRVGGAASRMKPAEAKRSGAPNPWSGARVVRLVTPGSPDLEESCWKQGGTNTWPPFRSCVTSRAGLGGYSPPGRFT